MAIAVLAYLGPKLDVMLLLGSFGASIAAMMATRTTHPPAGSNPVIVFLGHSGWGFLLFPVLSGAVILVLVALFYNNVVRKTSYPHYW